MNTGVMDAHNLAWKLAMLCRGIAKPSLLSSYDIERRENALRAVATSARYLRFVGNCTFDAIDGSGGTVKEAEIEVPPGEDKDIYYFKKFVGQNGRFLIGLDIDYRENALNKLSSAVSRARAGYRASNPRVALSRSHSGRLYHSFGHLGQFTLLVFASNLGGAINPKLHALDSYLANPSSFYHSYGGADTFKIVVVARSTPSEADRRVKTFPFLSSTSQVVYDDQLPLSHFGGDAHALYGASHEEGAIVVVRPDTWIGTAVTVSDAASLEGYFNGFLFKSTEGISN